MSARRNHHIPIYRPRLPVEGCLADGTPWPCSNVDAYWLPKEKFDWEQVPSCSDLGLVAHTWGPWVLSPVYPLREDRFCIACGVMEMQTMDTGDE